MAKTAALRLTRNQILSYRRRVSHLDRRLPYSPASLQAAAPAGLTDSMPRAALLSLHARVESVQPDTWDHPSLAQVWGPRFSAYVVAADDWAPFTLGRMPRSGNRRGTAAELLTRLTEFLGSEVMEYSKAGKAMGLSPNSLRYATLTGRVMIRWEGSGKPLIWVTEEPPIGEEEARRELVRRHLQAAGVGDVESFGKWAGVNSTQAKLTFAELEPELMPVATPLGERVALQASEPELTKTGQEPTTVRLLPSGDIYYLLQGIERELLVPDQDLRPELWTSRVWPGAVLIGNEVVGTWRRNKAKVLVSTWTKLTQSQRSSIAAEAEAFPLLEGPISVSWD